MRACVGLCDGWPRPCRCARGGGRWSLRELPKCARGSTSCSTRSVTRRRRRLGAPSPMGGAVKPGGDFARATWQWVRGSVCRVPCGGAGAGLCLGNVGLVSPQPHAAKGLLISRDATPLEIAARKLVQTKASSANRVEMHVSRGSLLSVKRSMRGSAAFSTQRLVDI